MERRAFLRAAAVGTAVMGAAGNIFAADTYFPSKVDPSLFESINRVKDPQKKTPLEKSHAPVITAPQSVRAGEPFQVTVSVGENLHGMGPMHWIEYIELNVGNEPVARAGFEPRGYASPKVTFMVTLQKDAAPSGKVTLVAHQRCNLHGLWEGTADLTVS